MTTLLGALCVAIVAVIFAAYLYGTVANAYRETVLCENNPTNLEKIPAWQRYAHFIGKACWDVVFPVLLVIGAVLKLYAEDSEKTTNTSEETCWTNGGQWKRNNVTGGWYSYDADDDDPGPTFLV